MITPDPFLMRDSSEAGRKYRESYFRHCKIMIWLLFACLLAGCGVILSFGFALADGRLS